MERRNDINGLDSEDIGLKGIFGDRFHDETTAKPEAAKITRKAENPAKAVKAPAIEPKDSKREVQWIPPKPTPNQLDKLKACAKSAMLFGGLTILFFYWQQTGQMTPSAAVPSMCACTCLLGLGVGKNAVWGNR